MSAPDARHDIIFGQWSSVDSEATESVGVLATALAATLVVGTSHSFAGPDLWSFDSFITPGPHEAVGTGDQIIVYRHIFSSFENQLPPPVFSATLSHIAAWGRDHVVFHVNLMTGEDHPTTIRLPRHVIRLSLFQHLRRFICPLPRSSTPPSPINQYTPAPKRPAGTRAIGDRVPRDSDDLPMWKTRRISHLGIFIDFLSRGPNSQDLQMSHPVNHIPLHDSMHVIQDFSIHTSFVQATR